MIEALLPALTGTVTARRDADYEQVRRECTWVLNVPPRRPELIVRAASVEDVVAVVRHAAERRMPVTVKGTGHSHAAAFLRDGGIMLDVSALACARMLDDGITAQVGPGIRSAEVAAFLAGHGRAFPQGHSGGVGIGGFLLGGGMGFNGVAWGEFSAANVEAVDVVTAAGELLTVSAEQHPDLFWAARGAGPGFPAVAVGFRLRTFPLPAGMHSSRWTYPFEAARAVAQWLQAHADGPDGANVERFVSLEATATGGHVCKAVAIAFEREIADARAALATLADSAPPGALDAAGPAPVSFARLYAGGITGEPGRTVNDTIWTDDPVGATVALARRVELAPSPRTIAMVDYRPAPSRSLPDMAVSIAARGFLSWGAKWGDQDDDAINVGWNDVTQAALEPFSAGSYVNETDVVRHPERARRCFTAAAWERLLDVRREYDPRGLFPPAW
ncbi:FAD-binding oxidoreductase [Conexibacter sp. JD483]|uniref:FAD-binding oxidoreductase n=1 Tax=unclassified Conexibacter TaxID=2627773 RepID=UPI00271C7438|nr:MULTISPECIES: FAD-binding oxidoreductase [unclassified Conexibacter]MDO8186021.1 FAD-binding oxidoreductase [Conexibacter sp. CPCC 205706]MDO8199511.1 FAD-binding oxidoreductase [Conexibacter sp. CPCC 205762]MDR9368954.1 FAD-binding oxidoreductase [Conexibacter sp. JD483]